MKDLKREGGDEKGNLIGDPVTPLNFPFEIFRINPIDRGRACQSIRLKKRSRKASLSMTNPATRLCPSRSKITIGKVREFVVK